jgi:hypothetical protein
MIWPFWGNFWNIFQIAKYVLFGFGKINKHKRGRLWECGAL